MERNEITNHFADFGGREFTEADLAKRAGCTITEAIDAINDGLARLQIKTSRFLLSIDGKVDMVYRVKGETNE